ncbi:NAD(P)-binding protein [Setomelanomma holmii]|uniref:NAD(P)-binding protein n=1 Tax=Setomelanomma holmii TaxID=210430 RepID=A0A9P4LHF5_9PLEO|nr:NAD(P)-binding protein [Setomelanomma holmii]
MVKIAIAGGAGNVAQEIVDVLVASKKHEIMIFTRRDAPQTESDTGISWAKTEYSNVDELTKLLTGVHTVLSFISVHQDQEGAFKVQKNLIDASIAAGVKRFAPSEWASSNFSHLPWYTYKAMTRDYLCTINANSNVLEYCLFQPGLFLNYLTRPYNSAKHVKPLDSPFDFAHRRALMRKGGDDDPITLTMVQDLANVVAQAVEFEGEWPVVGGMSGSNFSIGELIALGEDVRGSEFVHEHFSSEQLESGNYKPSWFPVVDHPSILPEHVEAASKMIVSELLLAIRDKAFEVGDEWNKLLPEYKFTEAEGFLREAWAGKP